MKRFMGDLISLGVVTIIALSAAKGFSESFDKEVEKKNNNKEDSNE